MTIYQELSKIKNSLLRKIDQHSHKEGLKITVRTEEYEFGSDTVVLLYDSNDMLLLDETYTENHSDASQAITKAKELLNKVVEWVADEDVIVSEEIKEVCF